MVKALDTLAADGAMSAAARSDRLAIWAQLRRINAKKHGAEIDVFIFEAARILEGHSEEEEMAESCDGDIDPDRPSLEICKQQKHKIGRVKFYEIKAD